MVKYTTTIINRIFDSFNILILTLFTITCIYPFYYVLLISFSDPKKSSLGITIYPIGITFNSYETIFKLQNIYNSFVTSSARTIIGTVLTISCCSIFAYALSKPELPCRKFIYRASVITMYFNAGLIPWYMTMRFFGLKDNFLLYVLPYAVNAFFLIIIKTYFEQIPISLEESAKLDGAGYFTVYRRIYLPLSKPIIATVAVFAAVGQWNSWSDNYFLVNNPKLQTLQYILYTYLSSAQNIVSTSGKVNEEAALLISPQTIKATITIVTILPIMAVYPFMQKYFLKGLLLGAVKA